MVLLHLLLVWKTIHNHFSSLLQTGTCLKMIVKVVVAVARMMMNVVDDGDDHNNDLMFKNCHGSSLELLRDIL